MAIQVYTSKQQTAEYRGSPIDDHGKLRVQYFEVEAVTVQGDAGSTFDLCELPPGAVRIIPNLCRFNVSALGAARTLDFGHRAYSTRPPDNAEQAEDLAAIVADIDASSALTGAQMDTATKFDMYSRAGVVMTAQVNDGTTPVGATLSGCIVYVYE